MNFRRIVPLVVAIALASACSVEATPPDLGQVAAMSTDEAAEQRLIRDQVTAAIDAKDFAALNAMARDFRTSRSRTPSGLWKLDVFYSSVQSTLREGLESAEGCQFRRAPFVRQWVDFAPQEPAATITLAALTLSQGWCWRGGGYADTVSAVGWQQFRWATDAAFSILDNSKATASPDPEFYATMLNVYRAKGQNQAEAEDLLAEALEREPYYLSTYVAAAWSHMPQWGGSFAEVDQFARAAAARTGESHKQAFYARIYWSLEDCGCDVISQAADWATMKRAMRDIFARYPVRFNAAAFERTACRQGDEKEALHYMRAQHPEATGDGDFVIMLDACRRMAAGT